MTDDPLAGTGIHLSPHQARLLRALIECSPEIVLHEQIMEAMQGDRHVDDWPFDDIVKVTVYKIRRKIAGQPFTINTARGHGYALMREPGSTMPWEMKEAE